LYSLNVDIKNSIDKSASFSDAQEKIEMLICHSPMVGEVIVYSMIVEIDYSDEFVN
jgi:hypothetical protein|tara:strand:- start:527 stop:694 length:168 start_codon:yes stop_codon:yes gene_type:complete